MSTNHNNSLSDSPNTKPSNSPALSLNAIEQQLNNLVEQHRHRFDPVRFRFIEAMLQRSKTTQPVTSNNAIQRLADNLYTYQQHFQQAQQQAQQHCQTIEQHSAEMASTALKLFDQHQFQAIDRLNKQLARQQQRQHNPLQQLTESLLQDHAPETQSQGSRLNQQLSQQEAAASASLVGNVSSSSKRSAAGELKSIALFRDSWAKRHIDNLTTQAINNRPDNPGPLNPERLASGSLSRIKDISPRYLNRFIGYVDTLLWLQQADQQRNKAVKKQQAEIAKGKKPNQAEPAS